MKRRLQAGKFWAGSYTNGKWVTTYPKSVTGNPFISALMWPVPASGLPSGINPVSMTASFYTNVGTISKINWQWSAAVCTQAPANPNALGMVFADGSGGSSSTPTNGSGGGVGKNK